MAILIQGGHQAVHTETYPSPFRRALPTFDLAGLTFGGHHSPLQVSSFSPGTPEARTQDVTNDVADGDTFGRDYLTPPTWSWDLFTDLDTDHGAHELAEQVAAIWLDEDLRSRPGAVIPLRYLMAGRWRRVYGRPRRYAGPDGGLLTALGRAEMTADFKLAHHLHYDDIEQAAQVGTVPARVGGFVFPAVFPLTTATRTESERSSQFTVGGSAPAWPRITVEGPISDATISVGTWSMRLTGAIAYDQSVIVDTAPWMRSITRGDGAPLAGALHPTTSMLDLKLKPGHYELKLTGTDLTGTARATIAWRDAYYGL